MPIDDDHDDDRPGPDRLLPADDRLWRHPSELGPPAPPAPPSRRPAAVALAGAGVAGALLALGAMWFAGRSGPVERRSATVAPARSTAATPPPSRAASFSPNPVPTEQLATDLSPSLALVRVERDGAWTRSSAIWIDRRGTLATALPEVAGATRILVVGTDGDAQEAQVAGTDDATGVAALLVDHTAGTPATRPGRPTRVGQAAAVIGAAGSTEGGGSDQATVAGVIVRAATIRSSLGDLVLHDSVQLDRALPEDVAGGAVVDADGRLLGMVVGNTDDREVGAVTPGTLVLSTATELRDHGQVRRAWLGVRSVDLDPALSTLLGLPGGAVLTQVDAGSPAAAAGLRSGDIVVAVDDRDIADASDLVVTLRSRRPGTAATLTVRRGALQVDVKATLGG